jgi:hypothetical protein
MKKEQPDQNKTENKTIQNTEKLQWGSHNQSLTAKNFIDGKQQNDAGSSVDLSKEEPGRNRKGVKEGENSLAEDSKKGLKK